MALSVAIVAPAMLRSGYIISVPYQPRVRYTIKESKLLEEKPASNIAPVARLRAGKK